MHGPEHERDSMPISQVTHINHVTNDAVGAPVDAADILAELASAEVRDPPLYFKTNPKLLIEKASEVRATIEAGCHSLDPAGCLAQAAGWKAGANALITKDRPHAALIGYLVGLWYLRPKGSALPTFVAHAIATAREKDAEVTRAPLDEAVAWLGSPAGSDDHAHLNGELELQTSLYLNVAAAALKLSLWAVARVSCERTLGADATNAKASYRLAKAHEGEGDLSAALSVLTSLLKREPQNADARKLHAALRSRQGAAKEAYRGLFAGAAKENARE